MFRSFRLVNLLRSAASARAMFILSALMSTLMLLLVSLLIFDLHHRQLEEVQGEVMGLSRIIAEQTTRTFEGVSLVLQGTQERLTDDFGLALDLGSDPVNLLLRLRIAGLPQVKSIFVADRSGIVRNSSRGDLIPGLSVIERDFFRYYADGGKEALFISSPQVAKIDGQWTFYLSRKLVDIKGHFRGVVVAAISIEYFETLYGSIGLDFVEQITLLNRGGVFLAGYPRDASHYGRLQGEAGDLDLLQERGLDVLMLHRVRKDDSAAYFFYRAVDKFPMVVALTVSEHEALMPWRRMVWPILGGVLLVLLFIALVTYVLIRNTLRKEVLQTALQDSNERLQHLIASVMDAIVTVDGSLSVVLVNDAAERVFGLSASRMVGEPLSRILDQASCAVFEQRLRRYQESGVKHFRDLDHPEIVVLLPDGRRCELESSFSATNFRGQPYLTAVLRDISERRRAESELQESNRQLEALAEAMQNVREEERAHIARELHDELGQLLTGAKLEVSWLIKRIPEGQEDLREKMASLDSLIVKTIQSVRHITSELRPLLLDDLGLFATINWLADATARRAGIDIRLQLLASEPERGSAVATALFRIIQEALTNVTKYAQASRVDINLLPEGNDGLLLTVADNGIGFDPHAGARQGFGLIGMRERVRILGGQLNIVAPPQGGIEINVRIPMGYK